MVSWLGFEPLTSQSRLANALPLELAGQISVVGVVPK
jgi:hypothetical protein